MSDQLTKSNFKSGRQFWSHSGNILTVKSIQARGRGFTVVYRDSSSQFSANTFFGVGLKEFNRLVFKEV